VLLNLCLIGAAFAGRAWLEVPVLALGIGVLIAGVLQVLLQVPPLRSRGLAPRPLLDPTHPALRALGRLMLPAVLGASVFQLNLLVSRFLASFLGDGAVSFLYYGSRLIEFPLGVFVFALGAASLPSFARLVSADDRPGLRESFGATLGVNLALCLPSTLGLMWLCEPIFGVLFGWDPEVFGAAALEGTSRALWFYALGLVPIAVTRSYVNLCVAHHDTATPARGAGVSLVVHAFAALALIGPLPAGRLPGWLLELQHGLVVVDLGFVGLALASTIGALGNAVYVIAVARTRYGALVGAVRLRGWLRLVVATGALAATLALLEALWPIPPRASLMGAVALAVHVLTAAAVYAAVLALLKSEELSLLAGVFQRRTRPGAEA
jgi:putative peptidoglycan lipid II flippase